MTSSTFVAYRLKESSPQLLGQIILVATHSQGPDGQPRAGLKHIYARGFAFIEKHSPRFFQQQLTTEPVTYQEVGVTINSEFLLEVALDWAKGIVAEVVAKEFAKSKNAALFATPYEFEKLTIRQFVLLWVSGRWKPELEELQATANCDELSRLLGHLSMVSVRYEKSNE